MLPLRDDSRTVNAWWYGTRGADAVVDQAALQAAADAAAVTGRALYIPRGIYRVTDTILIGANTRVYGDGIGATILRGKAGAYPGKTVNGNTLYATIGGIASTKIIIEDLTVDHFTNGTSANGIAFIPDLNFTGTPCAYCTVQRCAVSGFVDHEYLIWSMRGQHMKIVDNFVDGNTTVFGAIVDQIGIGVFGSLDVLVDGNTVIRCEHYGIGVYVAVGVDNADNIGVVVTNNYTDACRFNINLSTASGVPEGAQNMADVTVADNIVRNAVEVGVYVFTPIAGTTMTDVAVNDNEISGGPIAIYIFGMAADTGHRNVRACGNQCYGQTTVALAAITISNFHRAAANGNQVAECAGDAFRITGSNDVSICFNEVHRSQNRALTADTVTRLAVNDNRFIDCSLLAATYGVLIDNSTDSCALRNTCSQASAFALIAMVGNQARLADNVPLATGAATPWINLGPNANASFAAPAAPGVGVAFIDIANTLATNAVNLGALIIVTQTAGAPNPATVTRVATGFRLTFTVNAVGNETYAWEIRQ